MASEPAQLGSWLPLQAIRHDLQDFLCRFPDVLEILSDRLPNWTMMRRSCDTPINDELLAFLRISESPVSPL
jgi:hypothetical protein